MWKSTLQIHEIKSGLNWISLLWSTSLAGGFLSFFTQMLLARTLTVADYGALNAAYRMVSLLAPMASFGVGPYWLKVFGKEGHGAQRWTRPSLVLVGIVSLACMSVLLSIGALMDSDDKTGRLVALLIPLVVFWACSELGKAKLQLEARYGTLAVLESSFLAGCFLVALVAFLVSGGADFVAAGYSIVALITAALHCSLLRPMIVGRLDLKGHDLPNSVMPKEIFRGDSINYCAVVKGAWPFALAGMLYLIHYQVGLILLERLLSAQLAGIYSVAMAVTGGVYLLPAVIYGKFLMPKIHRWAEHDWNRFIRMYKFGAGVMLLAGVVFGLGVAISAVTIVPWLFGERYIEAGGVLFILAIGVPIRFLGTNVGSVLVTGEHMKRKNRCEALGVFVSILLNLLSIPRLGIYGAALSAVLTELALVFLFLWTVRRHVLGKEALRGWTIRISTLGGKEKCSLP